MTPDPSFLFQTTTHREALAALLYAVLEEKGFIVLTGEAGTGKTTLLSRMLRMIPSNKALFSLVINPTLSADEFIESALLDFGIAEVPSSKARRLLKLQQFVMAACTAGRICVLVADEAHKLQSEVLEEIRLLTNFENSERKLLQIIMVGQPELRTTLKAEHLRQLKQRIAVFCELQPLSQAEVTDYIHYRWSKAGGGNKAPFDLDALQIIVNVSKGLPRVINALCDNALVLIYGAGDAVVTSSHLRQVVRDLDLVDIEHQAAVHDRQTGHGSGSILGPTLGAAVNGKVGHRWESEEHDEESRRDSNSTHTPLNSKQLSSLGDPRSCYGWAGEDSPFRD